jgi:hypothetical protein
MLSMLTPSNRTPTLPVPLTLTDSISRVIGNGVINNSCSSPVQEITPRLVTKALSPYTVTAKILLCTVLCQDDNYGLVITKFIPPFLSVISYHSSDTSYY